MIRVILPFLTNCTELCRMPISAPTSSRNALKSHSMVLKITPTQECINLFQPWEKVSPRFPPLKRKSVSSSPKRWNKAEAGERAKNFARRVVMRLCRNLPHFGDVRCESFFRPYWIAYYRDPQGTRPRYLPFEADGLTFKR